MVYEVCEALLGVFECNRLDLCPSGVVGNLRWGLDLEAMKCFLKLRGSSGASWKLELDMAVMPDSMPKKYLCNWWPWSSLDGEPLLKVLASCLMERGQARQMCKSCCCCKSPFSLGALKESILRPQVHCEIAESVDVRGSCPTMLRTSTASHPRSVSASTCWGRAWLLSPQHQQVVSEPCGRSKAPKCRL